MDEVLPRGRARFQRRRSKRTRFDVIDDPMAGSDTHQSPLIRGRNQANVHRRSQVPALMAIGCKKCFTLPELNGLFKRANSGVRRLGRPGYDYGSGHVVDLLCSFCRHSDQHRDRRTTASGSVSQASMTAARSESSGSARLAFNSAGDAPVRDHSLPYVMVGLNALVRIEQKPLWNRVFALAFASRRVYRGVGEEAPPGFEPGNNGFCRPSPYHLATEPARKILPAQSQAAIPVGIARRVIRATWVTRRFALPQAATTLATLCYAGLFGLSCECSSSWRNAQEFPFQVLGKSDPNDLPGP